MTVGYYVEHKLNWSKIREYTHTPSSRLYVHEGHYSVMLCEISTAQDLAYTNSFFLSEPVHFIENEIT
jgi:hypothetical protein